MSTAIIPQRQVDEYTETIRAMLDLPPDVPDSLLKATSMLALRYNLDPFTKEIQIIPGKAKKVIVKDPNGRDVEKWQQSYMTYVGVNGLARSARRVSTFDFEPRVLSSSEMKELRGPEWDALDVGVEITLYRHDVEKRVKEMGRQYHPIKAIGIWRQKARETERWSDEHKRKVKTWESDPLPNTMTRQGKAEQRALRAALKIAYDLTLPDWVQEDDATDGGPLVFEDSDEPVEGVVVHVEEPVASLMEAGYSPAEIGQLTDEEQEIVIEREAKAQEIKNMPPEELAERFEKNKKEMRGRRNIMADIVEPPDLLPPDDNLKETAPFLTKGVIPNDPKAWEKVNEALDWAVEQGVYDSRDHAKTMFLGVNSLASRNLQEQFAAWKEHCEKVLAARVQPA